MGRYRGRCGWCAIPIGSRSTYIVDRDAGPIPFCQTCLDRYENPDLHPYLRKCLEVQGR